MSEKTTRRTQAERTQQRKEQILQAAIRSFAQDGYRGARMADIARAAGVTEPGLLHHFPSKVHLLMDVLAERDRIDQQRLASSKHEGMAAPLAPLRDLAGYNETVPGLVQLFTVLVAEAIDGGHPAHTFFSERYVRLRENSIAALVEAQARGEVRTDVKAEDLAILIYALMDGLQVQWLYEPGRVEMARLFETFLTLLGTCKEKT